MSYNYDSKTWANIAPSAEYKSIGEFFKKMMEQNQFDNVQVSCHCD
jgi:hypothetical protein